jgi:hypothetical protein
MTSKKPFGSGLLQVSREMRNSLATNTHAASSATDDAIYDFLSSLDCPRSLAVWLLFSNKEHQQLIDLTVEVGNYVNGHSFRNAYLATEFLSKSTFLTLNFDKKKVAFEKFKKYESLCKQTNDRFRNLSLDPLYRGANVELLSATRRKISHILGDLNPYEIFRDANWGPGVTTLLKGEHVSSVNKFHEDNGITRDLYSLIGDVFPVAYPLWFEHLRRNSAEAVPFSFQVGNSVVTVPKNAKTDRVIAVEPALNLWFQKSIGTMIRRRLLRSGIDLNHQSFNQEYARIGSITDSLATIDFSSASDSISRKVVEELLPPDWFKVMNAMRSVVGKQQKEVIRWEKFSSMGNGFTFELESLIFLAAAQAVAEHLQDEGAIYIHGDDVIIPSPCVALFSSFSAFLGFNVNLEKTHVNSPFRESCGEHWYLGTNCKPIYLKDRLRTVETFYKLANSVRMLAHRSNFNYGCDSRFRRCWVNLYRRVPKQIRFCVPAGKGDVGFISNFDEATPVRSKNGIEGFHYLGVTTASVKSREFEGEGLLLASLWANTVLFDENNHHRKVLLCSKGSPHPRISPLGHGNHYDLRGRSRVRVSVMHTLQWYNLGPWL